MKAAQQKGLLTVIVATIVVVLLALTLSLSKVKGVNYYNLSSDPLLERKAQILALATTGSNLTLETRSLIFQSLSGEQLLKYNFTPAEKAMIIDALNKN